VYAVISLIVFVILFFAYIKILKNITILGALIKILLAYLGMITTYNISYLISNKKPEILNSKFYKLFSRDTFGVYLYSDSLNYMILSIGFSLFKSRIFEVNAYSFIFILIRIVFTILIALAITEILRKLKIKYLV
jgi:hypothetical protein